MMPPQDGRRGAASPRGLARTEVQVALKKCSECGGQVSSRAVACPHCGAPVRRMAPVLAVAVGLLAAGAVALGLWLQTDSGEAGPTILPAIAVVVRAS